MQHLAASADGNHFTRWHLEAGIAFEHTSAPSVAETNWERVLAYYEALNAISPGPVVALNRGLALSEARGLDAGRAALASLANDPKLAKYSFRWAARADLERRSGRTVDARNFYERAITFAKSRAESCSLPAPFVATHDAARQALVLTNRRVAETI